MPTWPVIAWWVVLVFHSVENRGTASAKPLELSTAENAIAIVEWFAGEALRLPESVREDAPTILKEVNAMSRRVREESARPGKPLSVRDTQSCRVAGGGDF